MGLVCEPLLCCDAPKVAGTRDLLYVRVVVVGLARGRWVSGYGSRFFSRALVQFLLHALLRFGPSGLLGRPWISFFGLPGLLWYGRLVGTGAVSCTSSCAGA